MDYLTPLNNNLGYSLAVEKLLGIEEEINDKINYARVILAELQRIASHLVWLGTSALDLGAMSMFLYCFREREMILDIFELCSGVRMMTSYICPVSRPICPRASTSRFAPSPASSLSVCRNITIC
jgi:NADH-quinone oxidoreductase subunit D